MGNYVGFTWVGCTSTPAIHPVRSLPWNFGTSGK